MKTLEQIKNDYSVDLGYADWEDLMIEVCYFSTKKLIIHENEVMKIYAMECLKLASENASMVAVSNENGGRNIVINKESITNENNIIK